MCACINPCPTMLPLICIKDNINFTGLIIPEVDKYDFFPILTIIIRSCNKCVKKNRGRKWFD